MKIYFAGADNKSMVRPLLAVGVKYALTSYEAWNTKGKNRSESFNALPYNEFASVIVDSGLFSYLWGKKAHIDYDKNFYYTYLDNYSKFIEASRFENMLYAELDVQEKLGIDFAWELREKLVGRFGKDKIINVCHSVDGDPSQLLEYAEYLAVSAMSLIKNYGKDYFYEYIKYFYTKASLFNTKVHLFGMTQPTDIRLCYGATSCDSTAWLAKKFYGDLSRENYFHSKGGYLDVQNVAGLYQFFDYMEERGISLGETLSERYHYYAAYTALLHYQSIDSDTVN